MDYDAFIKGLLEYYRIYDIDLGPRDCYEK